ncbi:flagellar hook-length control protein FliK [Paenibacillus pinistramenti]|uniref:flagellar hook-length control protein FliK n=1 Tax=Paenibacillus pinistramenti TaxID=1768003 RepID=UPI00110A033C|nr:flagellar hook-length control protein FliK [Paenibacillus pinistramenti]
MSTILSTPLNTVSAPSKSSSSKSIAASSKQTKSANASGGSSGASAAGQTAAGQSALTDPVNASSNDKGKKAVEGSTSFSGTLYQFLTGELADDAASQDGKTAASSENSGAALTETLLSLLQGAAGTASADEAGSTDSNTALINALDKLAEQLQDAADLQELTASNPELMAQLQAWIQQAMQQLQQAGNAALSDNEGSAALTQLAGQPETIKFALMDTIQSMKDLLTGTGAQGTSQTSFMQLVTSLQKALGQTASQQAGAESTQAASSNADQTVQAAAESSNADGAVAAASVQASEEDSSSTQDQQQSDQSAFTGSNIVTAGQLQLRDNAAAQVKAQQPVPVEKFSQEVSGFIINKMDIVKLQGMSEAKITLTPEHLGQVDIRITLHNGQVVAQFVTEHSFAKESLEQQMSQLRSALQAQGLQVEKLEVTQNASLSSHMYHDGKQSGSGSQQRQNSKRRDADEEEGITSLDTLEEWNEWVREVQAKQDNYGSSFVAKA